MSELAPSMTEWTTRLVALGLEDASKGVDQGRLKAMRRVEELGLPHNKWTITPLSLFLENPGLYTADFLTEKCFAILASEKANTRRYRQRGLDAAGIVDLVHMSLPAQLVKEYMLILEHSPVYLYGGNIVCDKGGNVRLEMARGQNGQNEIVGSSQPEFTVDRNPWSGIFEHSSEDVHARRIAWKTIMAIPHKYSPSDHDPGFAARDLTFHPGYYEFYITEDSQPVFIDYSDQPAFVELPTEVTTF